MIDGPLSEEELKRLGFLREMTPEQKAERAREYNAQMDSIAGRIRSRYEARIAGGWQPQFAFEDALHFAANVGDQREATIQQMTIGASDLARGWEHSEAFVAFWNDLFPDAPRTQGFATPCIMKLGDGRTAAIAAEWSGFISMRKRDG